MRKVKSAHRRIVFKDGTHVINMRLEKWFVTGFGTVKIRAIKHTPKRLFERGKVKLAWRM